MVSQLNRYPIAYTRFKGKSLDLPLAELGVGELASHDDLKQDAARYLEVSANLPSARRNERLRLVEGCHNDA